MEKQFHESGWSIAIETPQGVVGLWSSWLNDHFYLGYPKKISFWIAALSKEVVIMIANRFAAKFPSPPEKVLDFYQSRHLLTGLEEAVFVELLHQNDVPMPLFRDGLLIPDRLIMDTLGVELALPVSHLNQFSETVESRLWAKFYGARVEGDKGRVWICHSDHYSNSHHFNVVSSNSSEGLESVYYGHSYSSGISTYPFSFWNKVAPDGPTAEPEVIQTYRDKFLALICKIASIMRGANAVNINYGFVLEPEQLSQLGYGNVEWLKGQSGVRNGWGDELIRGEKTFGDGKETVILTSGNSLVPWITIRRLPCEKNLTAEKLIEMLIF